MKHVYFDSAATTQLRDEVVDHMSITLKNVYGNPSSTHSYGRSAKSILEKCRKDIASLFGVSSGEIIFTSGGTEADNLILNSCVRDQGVERIISTCIEHHAVLHTIEELQKHYGIESVHLDLDQEGMIDPEQLRALLKGSKKKTLVSLMHINNEIGNMLDIDTVGAICREYGALFHSDTVQSIGHFELDLSKVPVDFAAVAAHKFHGPKGAGFAFIRKNTGIKSLIFGGAQERGFRAGTEAVYAIAGMTKALEMSYEHLDQERAYIQSIKDRFRQGLIEAIPGVHFNGACADNERSTYTLLNVCLPIPPEKAMMLLFQLDLKGIACSQGSACQSGSAKGSHVLRAIQSEEAKASGRPSLRFSFCSYNTPEEVDYTIDVLKEFIES